MPLDAEGAQDDAEREVERLEHRPLLDMELEIRSGVLELTAGLDGAVEVDSVPREHVGKRVPLCVLARTQLVLVRHRAGSRARAEERAPEPRSLLVGPVDEANRDRRLSLRGAAPHHPDAGHTVE